MTKKEAVNYCVERNRDNTMDSVADLVAFAYHHGQETSARFICDDIRDVFDNQIIRAEQSVYPKMAMEVQGHQDMLYDPDYAGEYTTNFGNDRTTVFGDEMSMIDAVNCSAEDHDPDDPNDVKALVFYAYFKGREDKARELGDRIADILEDQIERARQVRYYNVALQVQGKMDILYNPDYAGEYSADFGSDPTYVLDSVIAKEQTKSKKRNRDVER